MQTILLMQAYKKRFESKSVDVEHEKSEGENLVESARQTVLCTLPDGWEKKKLSKFLLAPCELESILLRQIVCFLSVRQMKLCRCTRR